MKHSPPQKPLQRKPRHSKERPVFVIEDSRNGVTDYRVESFETSDVERKAFLPLWGHPVLQSRLDTVSWNNWLAFIRNSTLRDHLHFPESCFQTREVTQTLSKKGRCTLLHVMQGGDVTTSKWLLSHASVRSSIFAEPHGLSECSIRRHRTPGGINDRRVTISAGWFATEPADNPGSALLVCNGEIRQW